ncbi:MAG: ornithine cyclodeaminase [Ilumatobacteraceae bacterium]|nr:ornithine cyclodeaminase [Ilumatobacteraceae bacterium]
MTVGAPPFIGEAELRELLPMAAAIDALDAAFAAGMPHQPAREHHDVGGSTLLVMPAWSALGTGIKLVTVAPGNRQLGLPTIHGVYALFEAGTGRPLAMIDGGALTALRTAAVSGVATRHLARADASRVVILGAGPQAVAHAEAMATVYGDVEIGLVGRDPQRLADAVRQLTDRGMRVVAAGRDDIAVADVVCLCTTSAQPVVARDGLADGVHVNAIGAFTPQTREVDTATVLAARVFVESLSAALGEAGDLLIPIGEGLWSARLIAGSLPDVVAGRVGRRSAAEITLYKGVGLAAEDLVVAAAAVAGRRG